MKDKIIVKLNRQAKIILIFAATFIAIEYFFLYIYSDYAIYGSQVAMKESTDWYLPTYGIAAITIYYLYLQITRILIYSKALKVPKYITVIPALLMIFIFINACMLIFISNIINTYYSIIAITGVRHFNLFMTLFYITLALLVIYGIFAACMNFKVYSRSDIVIEELDKKGIRKEKLIYCYGGIMIIVIALIVFRYKDDQKVIFEVSASDYIEYTEYVIDENTSRLLITTSYKRCDDIETMNELAACEIKYRFVSYTARVARVKSNFHDHILDPQDSYYEYERKNGEAFVIELINYKEDERSYGVHVKDARISVEEEDRSTYKVIQYDELSEDELSYARLTSELYMPYANISKYGGESEEEINFDTVSFISSYYVRYNSHSELRYIYLLKEESKYIEVTYDTSYEDGMKKTSFNYNIYNIDTLVDSFDYHKVLEKDTNIIELIKIE